MSDFKNDHYKGMYSLFEYKAEHYQYNLDGTVFEDLNLNAEIRDATGLEQGTLGDWWVFEPVSNPILGWHDLVRLALGILHCRATKLLVYNLHLDHMPSYDINHDAKLTAMYVSGAKRVNAASGDYTDYSAYTGLAGLMNPDRDISNAPRVENSADRFRLYGKDESCCVEGSWFDWVAFACNVLANENTKLMTPDLYEPKLKNSNY